MKKFFAQLRPLERRLAVGVLVVFILVLNWVFIWPHFSDWSILHRRLEDARKKLVLYQTTILQTSNYEAQVKVFEKQGEFVAPEDQSINFLRTIQSQALASQVQLGNISRPVTHTNDAFFVEQIQNINVTATDDQLVDFLYKLGSDVSMIRVLDLELQPDPPRQKLNAQIKLVASYQKNAPANLKTATAKHQMKTIHLRCATARQATLVLILFLTAHGLWAQTPPAPTTPAQPLAAATNNPTGTPAELPATPSAVPTTDTGHAGDFTRQRRRAGKGSGWHHLQL